MARLAAIQPRLLGHVCGRRLDQAVQGLVGHGPLQAGGWPVGRDRLFVGHGLVHTECGGFPHVEAALAAKDGAYAARGPRVFETPLHAAVQLLQERQGVVELLEDGLGLVNRHVQLIGKLIGSHSVQNAESYSLGLFPRKPSHLCDHRVEISS